MACNEANNQGRHPRHQREAAGKMVHQRPADRCVEGLGRLAVDGGNQASEQGGVQMNPHKQTVRGRLPDNKNRFANKTGVSPGASIARRPLVPKTENGLELLDHDMDQLLHKVDRLDWPLQQALDGGLQVCLGQSMHEVVHAHNRRTGHHLSETPQEPKQKKGVSM